MACQTVVDDDEKIFFFVCFAAGCFAPAVWVKKMNLQFVKLKLPNRFYNRNTRFVTLTTKENYPKNHRFAADLTSSSVVDHLRRTISFLCHEPRISSSRKRTKFEKSPQTAPLYPKSNIDLTATPAATALNGKFPKTG